MCSATAGASPVKRCTCAASASFSNGSRGTPGWREHLEPGAGVAERPGGQLDRLLRRARSRAAGAESVGHGASCSAGEVVKRFIHVLAPTVGQPARTVSTTCRPDGVETVHRRAAGSPEDHLNASIRDVAGHAPASRSARSATCSTGPTPSARRPGSGCSDRDRRRWASCATSRPATCAPGRSRTIGLVVLDIANPFFTDVARGGRGRRQRRTGLAVHPVQQRRPARPRRPPTSTCSPSSGCRAC